MLPPDKPKRVVSQAPLKDTECSAGCGAVVQYRTCAKVFCPPCKAERRLVVTRAAAEVQRRKRGVPKVKGTKIQCIACGAGVVLNRRADTKYCRPCYVRENGMDAVRRSKAKRATPEGREALNAWHRMKRQTDPSWRVSAHMRVLMHRGLNGGKAGRSWRTFVPYTLEDLMAHLERQFLPGMTWANKGEWHIDHIRPLSGFNYQTPSDPEFQEAWALSNLRPLWGLDNARKNARRLHLL